MNFSALCANLLGVTSYLYLKICIFAIWKKCIVISTGVLDRVSILAQILY